MSNTKPENTRKTDYKINSIFVNRWSPRSMTGEEISDDDLMGLFEAARWAPSSYNNQPWRFIYSKRKESAKIQRGYVKSIVTISKGLLIEVTLFLNHLLRIEPQLLQSELQIS